VQDGPHTLVYNFFYTYGKIDSLRVLPPPKQLDTDEKGRLILKTYYRWELMAKKVIDQEEFGEPVVLFSNPTASYEKQEHKWVFGARGGYEIFCFTRPHGSFIWEGILKVEGMGKFGLVTDMDKDGNGYFISFNISSGVVQIRAWGFNPINTRQNFVFNDIQSNYFNVTRSGSIHFQLIRYGHYIELSIDGQVKLTLIDYTYSGNYFGIYSASSIISLQKSSMKPLPNPQDEYASQEETQKL